MLMVSLGRDLPDVIDIERRSSMLRNFAAAICTAASERLEYPSRKSAKELPPTRSDAVAPLMPVASGRR